MYRIFKFIRDRIFSIVKPKYYVSSLLIISYFVFFYILPENLYSSKSIPTFWFQVGIVALLSYLGSSVARAFAIPELIALILVAISISPSSPFGVLTLEAGQLAWLAVMFKILHSGLGVNLKQAMRQLKSVLLCGVIGFLAPFLVTLVMGFLIVQFVETGSIFTFHFFITCALAFAVAPLALVDDILDSAKVRRTPFGTLVISSQALNEMLTWCIFALVASGQDGEGGSFKYIAFQALSLFALVLVFGGIAWFFGEKLSKSLSRRKVSSTKIAAYIIIPLVFFASLFDELFHGGIVCALLLGVLAGSVPYAGIQYSSTGGKIIKFVCLPLFLF